MKVFLKILSILIVSTVFLVVLIPFFIDVNSYKDVAISTIKGKTGLDIQIEGEVRAAVFPVPHLSVSDIYLDHEGDKLFSAKEIDVSVNLPELIGGVVSVSSISIVEPVLKLEKKEDGSFNLPILKAQEDNEKGEGNEGNSNHSNFTQQISLDAIHIKNGTLVYADKKEKHQKVIDDINAKLSAQSLLGPYTMDGGFSYDESKIKSQIKTEIYDTKEKSIALVVNVVAENYQIETQFSGAVDLSETTPKAQGHVKINFQNISILSPDYIKENALIAEALLTSEGDLISMKDTQINLGENTVEGSFQLNTKTQNVSASVKTNKPLELKTLLKEEWPYRTIGADISVTGGIGKLHIQRANIDLDETHVKIDGTYTASGKATKPYVDLNIHATQLDADTLFKAKNTTSANAGHAGGVTSQTVPVNGKLNISIDDLLYAGKKVEGVKASVSAHDDKLVVHDATIKNYQNSSATLKGEVNNIRTLDDIKIYADIKTQDAKALLSSFGMDTGTVPKGLKKGRIQIKGEGSAESLSFVVNADALGAEIITKGKMRNVSTGKAISDVVVQLKHKNTARLIDTLTGSKITDRNMQKPLDIYAELNQRNNSYAVTAIKGRVAGTSVEGAMDINLSKSKPSVEAKLDLGNFNMSSIVSDKAVKPGSAKPKSGRKWSKEIIDTKMLRALNFDIQLSAKEINYGEWPLRKVKLDTSLQNGTLKIKQLNAQVFGGNIDMSAQVQSSAEDRKPVHFKNETTFKNVDIGKLSSSLIGSDIVKISGRGDMKMNLSSAGASPAALVHDLSGAGEITGNNLVLDGVDVPRFAKALSYDSKPGDTILGLWKGVRKGGQTEFNTLEGDFTIQQGIVRVNKMNLDGDKAAINTVGVVNLPKWTVSTKHQMIVKGTEDNPSDIPPFEVSVSGSLDNPAQTFGQGALQNYLNRKIQRKLDKLLKDKLGLPTAENDNKKNAQENPDDANSSTNEAPKVEDIAEEAIKGILSDLLR